MIRLINFNSDLFNIRRMGMCPVADSVNENAHSAMSVPDKSIPEAVATIRACRQPPTGEPMAFCARCQELTPMQWLPVSERGKRAENWFRCEYCGNRDLTLRYLTAEEAIRRNSRRETG